LINFIFALLCGGATFIYLFNVCHCGFELPQWIFVSAVSFGVFIIVLLLGMIAKAIGRRLTRGSRSA
jgi:hypothetical protein